jgi:ArpU family phage transcriptional regulator
MNQENFKLPEIDNKKTKAAVEKALEKYRTYLLALPSEFYPKVTQTFTLVPPSPNNSFRSSTEDAAIHLADFENERFDYMEKIHRALNKLSRNEREIIIKCHIKTEDSYDFVVYNEMGYSKAHFYRLKTKAYYKLAFALRVEVYKYKKSS